MIAGHVDFIVLLYLAIAAVLDLFLRGVAFGRVESIAIDIGIFGTLYSSLELLKQDGAPHSTSGEWALKAMISLAALTVMTAYHLYLRNRLKKSIETAFGQLILVAEEKGTRDLAFSVYVLLSDLVEVDIGLVNPMKRSKRLEVFDLVEKARLDPGEMFSERSFLLPARVRRVAVTLFGVLGVVCFLVPAVH